MFNTALNQIEGTTGHLFSRATNFIDFMDLGTSTKFVSPKISGNSIVTQNQTEEKTPM